MSKEQPKAQDPRIYAYTQACNEVAKTSLVTKDEPVNKELDLKHVQNVLYNVQQVMAGYSLDDTWSDYDSQAHKALIDLQYQVQDLLDQANQRFEKLMEERVIGFHHFMQGYRLYQYVSGMWFYKSIESGDVIQLSELYALFLSSLTKKIEP
jgi:hypothetical protein